MPSSRNKYQGFEVENAIPMKDQEWAQYLKNLIAVLERVIYMQSNYAIATDDFEKKNLNDLRYSIDKRMREVLDNA